MKSTGSDRGGRSCQDLRPGLSGLAGLRGPWVLVRGRGSRGGERRAIAGRVAMATGGAGAAARAPARPPF